MELLLALLSLLTAATGAVAGAHAPEAGVHHAAGIVAVAPARKVMQRIAVAQVAPPSRATDEGSPGRIVAPLSAAPLYADRRRE